MVNLKIGDFGSISLSGKKDRKKSSNKAKRVDYLWEFKTDQSAWALVAANVITIILAVWQRWSLAEVMLTYWSQSVIIGIFHFIRILSLDKFDTIGFLVNGRPVEAVSKTKYSTAFFFLVHYGFFHLGYLIFLLTSFVFGWAANSGAVTLAGIAIAAAGFGINSLVFGVNHYFSFRYNIEKDKASRPNIGKLMFQPYLRIIPMHLTIVFGGLLFNSAVALVGFMLLKTAADVGMHLWQHKS